MNDPVRHLHNIVRPVDPLVTYSEFTRIGLLHGLLAYQVRNKIMTVIRGVAEPFPVPDTADVEWTSMAHMLAAIRKYGFVPPSPAGAVLLWQRRHSMEELRVAAAAMLMLEDRVLFVRSFDQGEKL